MHSRALAGLAFSPDGLALASVGTDTTLRFWDPRTGREQRRWPLPEGPYICLTYSVDGRYVAVSTAQSVLLYESSTGKALPALPHANVTGIAFTPNSSLIAASAGTTVMVRAPLGGEEFTLSAPDLADGVLQFSPDGRHLAVGGKHLVRIWDLARRKKVRTYELPEEDAIALCFSPDGQTLAVSTKDSVHTFELASEEPCADFEPTGQGVVELRYSANGKELLGVSADGSRYTWDAQTGAEQQQHSAWKEDHAYVRLSPDGKLVTAETSKGTIGLWDFDVGQERHPVGKHAPLYSLALNRPGTLAAVGTEDGRVHLFEPLTGQLTRSWTAHNKFVAALAFSPDGTTLATGGFEEPDLKLWNLRTGQLTNTCPGHGEGIVQMAFHPDGRTLFVTSKDHVIRSWDWHHAKLRTQWSNGGPIDVLALAPDGRSLATATGDQGLCLWELATGQERRRFSSFKRTVFTLAFAPDGQRLAVGIGGGMAVQYHPRTGAEYRCPEQTSDIMAVTYSPNSQWLALAGDEGVVVLAHAASGTEVARFVGHEAAIHGLAFLPDGQHLLSAALDGTVLLWDVRGLRYRPTHESLDQAQLADLWQQLAKADAGPAGEAVARLDAFPTVSVPYLAEHLQPVSAASAEQMAGWIRQLDDPAYAVRQSATRALEAVSDQAQTALRKAHVPTASAEVRQRIEALLAHAAGPGTPTQLRQLRCIEVLEAIATPPARQVLHKLASGASAARTTQEAQAALARLAPRPPAK
jgi:WD40 repeat protein